MSIHRMLAGACLASALALLAPPPSHASCPPDSVSLGGYGTAATAAAVLDSASSYGGSFHVAYHLPLGTLLMEQCCNLTETLVAVSDEYDVIGVPPGTPVSCSVEFAVTGSIQTPGGVATSTLRHGGDVEQSVHKIDQFMGWQPFSDQLTLDLTIVAGQPERISFSLSGRRTVGSAISESASNAHGAIWFYGLPMGASIISCQGFSAMATPTRTSTWGRLKSIYR